MVQEFWLGLSVSVVLGTAFCLVDFMPGPPSRRAVPAAYARRVFPATEWPEWLESSAKPVSPETQPLPLRPPLATAQSGSLPTLTPTPTWPETKPDASASSVSAAAAIPALPALPPPAPVSPPPAAASAALPLPLPPAQPSARRKRGGPAPMLPLRRMLFGRKGGAGSGAGRGGSGSGRNSPAGARGSDQASSGAASGAAFANLADVRDIDPTWDYYDLPEKGLDVWVTGQTFAAKQQSGDTGLSPYELEGREYSLGLRKDWSIDSVIGVSVDILDAGLSSSAMLDYRENDLAGYRVNVHYEGVAFDRLAFAAKAFYGRLDSEGGGYLQIHDQGDSWREEWREDKHGSEMYGFSGKAGLPLLWGPEIKVLPEVGVNLTKLRSREYSYVLSSSKYDVRTFQAARQDSASLTIPVSVTLRKDMLHGWGVLTPLLGLTYTTELDEAGGGVRALHAAAASSVRVDPATGDPAVMARDAGPKAFVRVDLGLEMRTVGGWRMDARYAHVFADKYTNDVFKLELGRCF